MSARISPGRAAPDTPRRIVREDGGDRRLRLLAPPLSKPVLASLISTDLVMRVHRRCIPSFFLPALRSSPTAPSREEARLVAQVESVEATSVMVDRVFALFASLIGLHF